ncbi:hypothetical protein BH20CHL7_BH20CHL7_18790 [soil metagenome]
MSHPSLGLPPDEQRDVHPDAARRIRDGLPRLADRALEVAIQRDPTMRDRYDEMGLRGRLHDARLLGERLALAVGQDDPTPLRHYAEQVAPPYRRKQVPMDDLIHLCEGLRAALPGVLTADEMASADAALDEAIEVLQFHRRLAGDARKKNAFIQAIYKGG